jgi:hypothetical protein
LRPISYQVKRKVEAGYNLTHTTGTLFGYMCALHGQCVFAAKQVKNCKKYKYFWLNNAFGRCSFPEGESPLYVGW